MREVCVLGIGQSAFGAFAQRSVATLGCEAARAALKDAGIEPFQLQGVYANQQYSDMMAGQTIAPDIGIAGIEMPKIENADAGGAAAVWQLWRDVAAGVVDAGMALGADSRSSS